MIDERRGGLSASAYEAASLCPDRINAERALSSTGASEMQSDDAARGTRIHDFLAGDLNQLPDDERAVAIELAQKRDEVVESVFGDRNYAEVKEVRLWMDDVLFSGKPDFVALDTDSGEALVIDYKTGRGEVTVSSSNLQLRSLALLVHENFEATTIHVAVAQVFRKPEVCTYDMADLIRAKQELVMVMEASQATKPPRIAGETQCKYCKAKATCKEAKRFGITELIAIPSADRALMNLETLPELLEQCVVAEGVVKAIKDRTRAILSKHPEAVKGWKLKEAHSRRVGDAAKVFEKLHAAKLIDQDAYIRAVKVNIGALEKAVVKSSGEPPEVVKAMLRETLGDLLTETVSQRLEQVK